MIHDIDYDMEVGGLKLQLTVGFSVQFHSVGRGTEGATVQASASPEYVQTMIAGMPFAQVKWADVPKTYPLYDWIRARATEINPEACGYTPEEALREAIEEEDETAYWENQIGRPI